MALCPAARRLRLGLREASRVWFAFFIVYSYCLAAFRAVFEKKLAFSFPGDIVYYRSVVAGSGFPALVELFFDTIFHAPFCPV